MDYCIKSFHDILYLVIYQYDPSGHYGKEVLRIPIAKINEMLDDFKDLIK